MTNSDTTLLIEFAEPIFKEFFLNQFDKKKNLNKGLVRELFEHNYPVRTISDVGGEILWAGSWVNTETLKGEN